MPLIIYHPDSPFKGQRYKGPVELIDIYPTLLEMAHIPHYNASTRPQDNVWPPLQGTSLVPIVLGDKNLIALKSSDSVNSELSKCNTFSADESKSCIYILYLLTQNEICFNLIL